MKTEEQQVTLRTLTPEECYWLTDNNGTFTSIVYLGKEDSGEEWVEVLEQEKEAYDAEYTVISEY